MQYFISFLEGIITFVSPCLLPMLPVYISYFAGDTSQETNKRHVLFNAFGFVLGFTLVFITLGAFAGSIGLLLKRYTNIVNILTGAIVIVFGLNFMGILKIKFLNRTHRSNTAIKPLGFFSALVFGVVFSIGWTPCVGAFLGSALMLASQQASAWQGILMLLFYSMGLGIPFIVSALLIERLKTTFSWIKAHYRVINMICGGILVLLGILMMTGLMGKFLSLLTF